MSRYMRNNLRRPTVIFSVLLSFCTTANSPAIADFYYVQVSSQRSESDARAAYRALQSRFPNQLANYEPKIHRVDLTQGSFFRAMVGPFTAADEAGNLCGALRAAGGICLILIDSGSVATPSAPNAASGPQPNCNSIQDTTARLACYDAANKKSTTKPQGTKVATKPQDTARTPKAKGTGTGFFVSGDGYLITNAHVVDSCTTLNATDATTNKFPLQ